MNQPKTLILTTNRTEAGEPVYAPCGDVRELLAQWRGARTSSTVFLPAAEYPVLERCAAALEAALKPQGDLLVARPLQIGVEYPPAEVKP
jgi:hypothetical protein